MPTAALSMPGFGTINSQVRDLVDGFGGNKKPVSNFDRIPVNYYFNVLFQEIILRLSIIKPSHESPKT